MAKRWYPVIDYAVCTECGSCVSNCPHGVYNRKKAPVPVVTAPDACADHCHGCGNRCPVGAITYVGDDTGWMPPHGVPIRNEACCEDGKETGKQVQIEFLYLDLTVCERCIATKQALARVMEGLTPALRLAGYTLAYREVEVSTEEIAIQNRLLTSPTIRVNGRDLFPFIKENGCDCCGEISGTKVDCRAYESNGTILEVPTDEMLAEGILSVVFGGKVDVQPDNDGKLPENLRRFYDGKRNGTDCGCGEGNEQR